MSLRIRGTHAISPPPFLPHPHLSILDLDLSKKKPRNDDETYSKHYRPLYQARSPSYSGWSQSRVVAMWYVTNLGRLWDNRG